MTVFVLVSVIDGYCYGAFITEEKAYEVGNALHRPATWEVYECEVQ